MPEQCGFTQRDTSLQVRGFCALIITQVHLVYYMPATSIYTFLGNAGFFCVAVFFFYSGYTMLFHFLHAPQTWATHFWRKKLVRLWLPFLGALFLYQLEVDAWYYHAFSLQRYIELLFMQREGNGLLWYLHAIFIYYIAAWLVLKLLAPLRTRLSTQMLGALASICCFAAHYFLYSAFISFLHPGMPLTHRLPFSLLVGMLWACFEPQLHMLLNKRHFRSAATMVLFILLSIGRQAWLGGSPLPSAAWNSALPFIVPVLFVLLLCCIFQAVHLENPVLQFLGSISGELYPWHAPFLYLICNDTFVIHRSTPAWLFYMACTLAAAWLSHYVNGKIEKRLLRPKLANQ